MGSCSNTLSGAYVFYADGTGMIGNNPLTWYADDTTLNCWVEEKNSTIILCMEMY